VQRLLGPHEGEKESSALAEAKDEPSEVVMWMEAQYWHVKTLKVLMGMSGDLVIEVAPSPLLDSQFLHTEINRIIKNGGDGYPTNLKDLQDLMGEMDIRRI
jgi:hypothetical protein